MTLSGRTWSVRMLGFTLPHLLAQFTVDAQVHGHLQRAGLPDGLSFDGLSLFDDGAPGGLLLG
jgi:hypothetical protein